jgi:hypothetical protein
MAYINTGLVIWSFGENAIYIMVQSGKGTKWIKL